MNATWAGIMAVAMFSVSNVLATLLGDIPGFELAAVTMFIGFASLTFFQIVRRENIKRCWHRPLSDYIFVTCGVGIYTACLYISFRMAPPFEANALNYLWPILIVVFSGFFNKEKLSVFRILGVLLGFAGSLALFISRGGPSFFSNFMWGHALAIFAAFIWALYSVRSRKKHYPAGFMAPVLLLSSLLCLILHFTFEKTIVPQGTEIFLVLLLGVFRISYALWDHGMRQGDTVFLASLAYFTPLVSMLLFVYFGFVPSSPAIAWGAALIVLGCLVVNNAAIIKLLKQKKFT